MTFKHFHSIADLCFSHDGNYLISISEKQIYLWSFQSNELIEVYDLDETFQSEQVKLRRTAIENTFCLNDSSAGEQNFQFWRLDNGKLTPLATIQTELIDVDFSFQLSENKILVADSNNCLIYDKTGKKEVRRIENAMDLEYNCFNHVAINHLGSQIAFLNPEENCLMIQDTQSGKVIKEIRYEDERMFWESDGTSILFDPTGTKLISACKPGDTAGYQTWDITSGEPLHEMVTEPSSDYQIKTMRISACGKFLWMTLPSDNGMNVHCWDMEQEEILFSNIDMPERTAVDIDSTNQKIAFSIGDSVEIESLSDIEYESLTVGGVEY